MPRHEPVRILVDAITLRPGHTGGAERFARELFRRLEADDSLELRYVSQIRPEDFCEEYGVADPNRVVPTPARIQTMAGFLLGKAYLRRLARRPHVDLLWSPFTQPALTRGVPEVLMVHDTAVDFYRGHAASLGVAAFEGASFRLRWARIRRGVRHARAVVVPSESVRRALERSLGRPLPNVHVIPEGGDSASARAAPLWQAGASREPLVLTISSSRPHKNLDLIARIALQPSIVEARVRFLTVGIELGSLNGTLPPNVEVRSGVSDGELGRLMASAACLLSPSLFEGFGLPIAEAMHIGLPVVVSDIDAHREVTGGEAAFFPSHDPAAAAAAVVRLVTDPAHAGAVSKRLRARALGQSWDRTAEAHARLFREVAGTRHLRETG